MDDDSEIGRVPPPYPQAMVVCDHIHMDPGTGKRFILGTFSVISAFRFPAIHPLMWLYIALTNGRGEVPIRIRLIDADEEQSPLLELAQSLQFPDPRAVVEFSAFWENVLFQAPGEYRFQLFAADEFLMERRILVAQIDA